MEDNSAAVPQVSSTPPKWKEADLHPFLVSFARISGDIGCHYKTINAYSSSKKDKNTNEWIHPDVIGVAYPFDDPQDIYDNPHGLEPQTRDIQKMNHEYEIQYYSFEIKQEITRSNLRQCYFQAVSNSSWANGGGILSQRILRMKIL